MTTTTEWTIRLAEITAEFDELMSHSKPTRAQEARGRELQEESRQIRIEMLREAIADGSARTTPGAPSTTADDFDEHDGYSTYEAPGRDRAKRIIDAEHRSGRLPDHGAERVTDLLTRNASGFVARWVEATGAPAYRSAFAKLLADPDDAHRTWTAEEADAYRAVKHVHDEMRALGLADAGAMVPLTLDPTILLTNGGTTNTLRSVARVVQTATDSWSGVTSAGVTAEWLAEAAEAADASPTLDDPKIPVHKGSAFVPFSYEAGMDAIDFLDELQGLLVDGAERLSATAYTTGSGIGQPKGFITALDGTASEVAPKTPETFAPGDIYGLLEALPPRFRGRASWQANLSVLNLIDQFETGNGAKQFPHVLDSSSPSLLGRPMSENSDMDGSWNPAATADNFVLAVGDFKEFVIVDRIGTTLELIPNLMGANRRPTGQRGAFLWWRTGSDVTHTNAFRVLNVATTA